MKGKYHYSRSTLRRKPDDNSLLQRFDTDFNLNRVIHSNRLNTSKIYSINNTSL